MLDLKFFLLPQNAATVSSNYFMVTIPKSRIVNSFCKGKRPYLVVQTLAVVIE